MGGYATVVFFDDKRTLAEWCDKMPNRREALAEWSKNGAGNLQLTVWTALAAEGLGANLQHFPQVTPGADAAMRKVIDVPAEWEVSAERDGPAGQEEGEEDTRWSPGEREWRDQAGGLHVPKPGEP